MMILWMAATAMAAPEEGLTLGELYGHSGGWMGNAYTTPRGMGVLHPLIRSSFGVTDQMDVKVSFAGLIAAPNLSMEVAPVLTDHFAVSLEPTYQGSWDFRDHRPGLTVHASWVLDAIVLTGSLTARGSFGVLEELDGSTTSFGALDVVRPEVGATIPLDAHWAFVMTGRTNVLTWDDPIPTGAVGAHAHFAQDVFGFSLGLNVVVLGTGNAFEDWADGQENTTVNAPDAIPLPLPHAQVWFRI